MAEPDTTRSGHAAPVPPSPFEAPVALSPYSHRLMFVGLALLSFALFAPTVVLPVLREYGELLAEEARLMQQVESLDRDVQRQDRLAEAFLRDAAVNERLALLDLHYQRPDETIVRLPISDLDLSGPPPETTPRQPRSPLLLPDTWPGWVTHAETWAQERGLISLFLDASLRPVFLLMSGGLIVAAFVLFAPRIPPRGDRNGPSPQPSVPEETAGRLLAAPAGHSNLAAPGSTSDRTP